LQVFESEGQVVSLELQRAPAIAELVAQAEMKCALRFGDGQVVTYEMPGRCQFDVFKRDRTAGLDRRQ
jgi:hypothetical protein